MSNNKISFHKEDKVAFIKLLGPFISQGEKDQLSDDFSVLYNEIIGDNEIRVIVVTGERDNVFYMEEGSSKTPSIPETISKFDLPVIAGIAGDAIGQGLELALACDIRIAGETSHFGLPQIKRGLIPWDGGTQRLSRLVGRAKALEMILTGEAIDALEAHRIGLINRVVPPRNLSEEVMGLAREMGAKSPISLRYAKEAICKGMDLTMEQGLRLEADLYFLMHTTKDRTEGIRAFQEKRRPRFEGR